MGFRGFWSFSLGSRPAFRRLWNLLGCAISQFESLGSWSKHPETGPKSIGIGLCRCVGTAPGILGLASSGLGAVLGPQIGDFWPGPLKFPGALLSSAESSPQQRFQSFHVSGCARACLGGLGYTPGCTRGTGLRVRHSGTRAYPGIAGFTRACLGLR